MKNRTRKKQLAEQSARVRQLPSSFVRDTLRAKAEAKAGKLTPYNPEFERQMALAESIMHDDREILRVLA
jgi:hypothetical protein